MIRNFRQLLDRALEIKGKRIVVVYPNNQETFQAVLDAHKMGLATFLLVGDENVICQALAQDTHPHEGIEVVPQPGMLDALRVSIALIRNGRGDILMKGGIDTPTMMKSVLHEDSGIRRSKLLSDIFILEFPERLENTFVMITDGGMTLAPDLTNKAELIRNAVEVAHALGNPEPKVAVLSATEFVLPNLQSTIDAAALAKMNERGQIKGCIVDGPLALDNAISSEAAAEKCINSAVAGKAEILIAANIESANSLAKSTTFFASLRLAHVIVGGSVPVLIPSRSDKSDAKLLSMALGVIMSDYSQVY